MHEAGALVVGGHSIIDEELKFGLSVTGRVHPKRILSNANAVVGDRLVLTKPLGTGLLATAVKQGNLGTDEAVGAVRVDVQAQREPRVAPPSTVGVRCATDVTGFGLLGHASHIAAASDVTLGIEPRAFRLLPGARRRGIAEFEPAVPSATRAYLESRVDWGCGTEARALLVDPQTSGGLLVAVPLRSRGRVPFARSRGGRDR